MITVFGSINLDLVFNVSKLPGPGETVLCPDYFKAAGGKGLNQAVAAARARPSKDLSINMVGRAGKDEFGDIALTALEGAGVNIKNIRRGPEPTACAAVSVDAKAENQIVVASGANTMLKDDDLPDKLLTPETVLVLQMEIPLEANCKIIQRAKQRGVRVLLNLAPAAPFPGDMISLLDLLVVNEVEAKMMANRNDLDTSSSRAAARAIAGKFSVPTIVSLGAQGAHAFSNNEEWQIDALPITPVDTVGAGDSFVGNLAVGMALNNSLAQMLHNASVAAGLACLTQGAATSMPAYMEVEERLGDLPSAQKVSHL